MLGCKGLKRGVLLPETQSQPLFLIQAPFFFVLLSRSSWKEGNHGTRCSLGSR